MVCFVHICVGTDDPHLIAKDCRVFRDYSRSVMRGCRVFDDKLGTRAARGRQSQINGVAGV